MKLVKDIWADLLEKKLWIPALFGIVLILVVPMYIQKPGPAPAPPAVPTARTDENAGPELALTRATNTGFTQAPHVNDKQLDPFGDRSGKKSEKAVKELNDALDQVTAPSGGTTTSGGGTSDDGGVTPNPSPTPNDPGTSTPGTTPVETETDDVLSILVQTASTDGTAVEPKEIDDIRTLSPLVDSDEPYLVYVGKASANTATFLVSSDVTVSSTSGGKCSPSPTDCRTLDLSVGETAEFTLLQKNNLKQSITVIDLETKKVPVDDGTDATATAARLENKARATGAKALKGALHDPEVVKTLVRNKIKIRK